MKQKFLINTNEGQLEVVAQKRVVIRGIAFAVHRSHIPRKADWVVSEWSTGARLAHSSGPMALAVAVARDKLTMWQKFNKETTVAKHIKKQIKKLKLPLINEEPRQQRHPRQSPTP